MIGGSPWRTIEQRTREAEGGHSDIDAVLEEDLVTPERVPSPLSMDDLDRVIGAPDLMPPVSTSSPWAVANTASRPRAQRIGAG